MKLKLDENLGRHTAEVLRAAGHDVSTVREEALTSASDQVVIEASRTEGRCLVTLDLGFGNPLLFDPRRFRGIAVIRLSPRPTAGELEEAVLSLSQALADRSIDGRLWVVQRGVVREYMPDDED